MCSLKTMVRIALGIGLLLIIGYLALPQYHATVASLAPLLLVLACPLAMYFGMKSMDGEKGKTPTSGDGH